MHAYESESICVCICVRGLSGIFGGSHWEYFKFDAGSFYAECYQCGDELFAACVISGGRGGAGLLSASGAARGIRSGDGKQRIADVYDGDNCMGDYCRGHYLWGSGDFLCYLQNEWEMGACEADVPRGKQGTDGYSAPGDWDSDCVWVYGGVYLDGNDVSGGKIPHIWQSVRWMQKTGVRVAKFHYMSERYRY